MKILQHSFYQRPTADVAIEMLGCILKHDTPEGVISGKIVEVEAYLGPKDPASHASIGLTGRTKIFWQGTGIAYVYFIYGMHLCFNVIAHTGDQVGGVLVRALEPLEGVELMGKKRYTTTISNLTSGPGKVTQALAITLADNGRDLTKGHLSLVSFSVPSAIGVTPRIGISKAREMPLRFFELENPHVSKNRVKQSFAGSPADVRRFLGKEPFTA
jgi:DNA-3-methyladenine glycosylase